MAFILSFTDRFHDLDELKTIFLQLDTSHDGKLSVEEIKGGLQKALGTMASSQKLYQQILEALDKDCNNYIDYTEFLTAAVSKEKLLTKKNLRTAFNLFDEDRSGLITLDELKKVFDMSGRKDS